MQDVARDVRLICWRQPKRARNAEKIDRGRAASHAPDHRRAAAEKTSANVPINSANALFMPTSPSDAIFKTSRPPLRAIVLGRCSHHSAPSPNRAFKRVCRGEEKGLTTVSPAHVKPSWRSSERSKRQPACDAAERMTASQIPS